MLPVIALVIVLAQEQARQAEAAKAPAFKIEILQPARADCHFTPPYCGACPWFVEYPPLAEPAGTPLKIPTVPEIPK